MARNAGLSSKKMADGGEVFTGNLASRALKAVGARAMTMDGSIFVNEGFGNTPEDMALYAHERVHESGSGGHDHGDHNHGNDPEEMAARAVERMVLHKARAGEDLGETLAKVRENMPRNQEEAEKQIRHALSADKDGEMREQSMMGYWALRSQGLSESDVNRMLSEFVSGAMKEIEELNNERAATNAKY
jgi:hypothetical protein